MLVVLKSRKDKERSLNDEIADKESMVMQKQNSIRQKLYDFQHNVKNNYSLPKLKLSIPSFEIGYKRDDEEIKNLSSKVENLIIKEVPRVR